MRTPACRQPRKCLQSFSLTEKRTLGRIEDRGIPSLGRVAPRVPYTGNSHFHAHQDGLQEAVQLNRARSFSAIRLIDLRAQAEVNCARRTDTPRSILHLA